jgi:hypothetical protein
MKIAKDLIVFLIDTSGSMRGNSIDRVNNALSNFFNGENTNLRNTDLLLLESYDGTQELENPEFTKIKDFNFNEPTRIIKVKNKKIRDGFDINIPKVTEVIKEWKQKNWFNEYSNVSLLIISDLEINSNLPWFQSIYDEFEYLRCYYIDLNSNQIDFWQVKQVGNIFYKFCDKNNTLLSNIEWFFNCHLAHSTDFWQWFRSNTKFLSVTMFSISVFPINIGKILLSIFLSILLYFGFFNGFQSGGNYEDTFPEVKERFVERFDTIITDTNYLQPIIGEPIIKDNEMTQKSIFYDDSYYHKDSVSNYDIGIYNLETKSNLYLAVRAYKEIILNEIFNKYPNPNKIQLTIEGETDGYKTTDKLKYEGEFGIINDSCTTKGERILISIKPKDSIENLELGFLRAKTFWHFILDKNNYFVAYQPTVEYHSKQNKPKGKKFRRIIFTVKVNY